MKIPILTAWLYRLRISRRLVLLSITFAAPLTAIIVGLIVNSIGKDIAFAQAEQRGDRYQRPLEALLEWLPRHQWLIERRLAGDVTAATELPACVGQLEEAFARLNQVQAELGSALQVTTAGLALRKREHVAIGTVQGEWQTLKGRQEQLNAAQSAELHAHLVADLRLLITHIGDTSNLILDPDLDSYYLMDVTLVALPQTQDRLAVIQSLVMPWLRSGSLTEADRTTIAVHAAMLSEADLGRVTGDLQTVLNEDQNFYGVSRSLQEKIPAALKPYVDANEALIQVLKRLAATEKSGVSVAEFLKASEAARSASFSLWATAVDELDLLLQTRINAYARTRSKGLAGTGLALAAGVLVAWLISRSINRSLVLALDPITTGAGQVTSASGQMADASQSLARGASDQAASLEETSASLEEMTSMLKRNAEAAGQAKELTGETRTAADVGAKDVQAMLGAMAEIKSSSNEVANIVRHIDEIAFQTNILALNAAVEAARAGEAGMGFAVVADEVRKLAQRCAASAQETAAKIESAITKSERGVQISTQVAQSFEQIARRAHAVDQYVANIATASSEQSQGLLQINLAVTHMDRITQSNAASAEESAAAAGELKSQADSVRKSIRTLQHLVGAAPELPAERLATPQPAWSPQARQSTAASGSPGQNRVRPGPLPAASATVRTSKAGLPERAAAGFKNI